jgi:methionyl-tRNA synthetase
MVNRLNGDLANGFGNLSQRVLSMIAKNCDGALPQPGALTASDERLLAAGEGLLDKLRAELGQQAFHRALDALWQVIGDGNRYVDEHAPWALRKSDPARMNTVLYVLAETIRRLAILTQPFMPDSCGRILNQLGVPTDRRSFAELGAGRALAPGSALPKPEGVFPRFVE